MEKYEDEIIALRFAERKFQITFNKELIKEHKDRFISGNADEYIEKILATIEPVVGEDSNDFG